MPTLARMLRTGLALLLALPLVAGGCTTGSATGPEPSDPASSVAHSGRNVATESATAADGSSPRQQPSELTILATEAIGRLDPQRISGRELAAFAGRTVTRTLTAYGTAGTTSAAQLVGDLATDTGTAAEGGRRWSFTLRDGLAWDDGSPLTCADIVYGVSRAFAPELTSTVSYPAAYLDIPHRRDGSSEFRGPYARGASARAGAAAYAKAVACDKADRTVTFTLAEPAADFGAMVSLPVFAPYPKARDGGPEEDATVVSSGPYRAAGDWTLARSSLALAANPRWDSRNDPIRSRPAERITVRQHVDLSQIVAEVAADSAHRLLAWDPAPPALFGSLTDAGKRIATVNPRTQIVDYLVPSFTSPAMKRPVVRRALALASDRAAYVRAIGGTQAAEPATSLLTPGVAGVVVAPIPAADPPRAKALLTEAGESLPVPITVAHRQGQLTEAGIAALRSGWEAAGFTITLRPVQGDYFDTAGDDVEADVYWGQWGPDYPTATAVLPPLFDAALNLTARAGPGLDYGQFSDSGTTARMTAASRELDRDKRADAWRAIDSGLRRDGAYIALAARKSLFYASADLGAGLGNEMLGGAIDLAAIGGD